MVKPPRATHPKRVQAGRSAVGMGNVQKRDHRISEGSEQEQRIVSGHDT